MSSSNLFNLLQFSLYKDNQDVKIYVFSLDEPLTNEYFIEQFEHYRRMNKKWISLFPRAIPNKTDSKTDRHRFNMFQTLVNDLVVDFNEFDSFVVKVTDSISMKSILVFYRMTKEGIYIFPIPEGSMNVLSGELSTLIKKFQMWILMNDKIRNPCYIEVMKLKSNRSIVEITSQEELDCFTVTDDNILSHEISGKVGLANLYYKFKDFMLSGYKVDNFNFERAEKESTFVKIKPSTFPEPESFNNHPVNLLKAGVKWSDIVKK